MILEEETFEAYGYYPSKISRGSHNRIIAACELCGKFRTMERRKYRTFCRSCSPLLGEKNKGEKSINFGKRGEYANAFKGGTIISICIQCGKKFEVFPNVVKHSGGKYCSRECMYKSREKRIKLNCLECGKEFEVYLSRNKNDKRKYCSKKCRDNAKKGENAYNYKGGRKLTWAKSGATRRRQLGYTLLIALVEGEVGHHLTNKYVLGIPRDVHSKLSGHSREKHRTLVLQWLKANDKKKYEIAVSVL